MYGVEEKQRLQLRWADSGKGNKYAVFIWSLL